MMNMNLSLFKLLFSLSFFFKKTRKLTDLEENEPKN